VLQWTFGIAQSVKPAPPLGAGGDRKEYRFLLFALGGI